MASVINQSNNNSSLVATLMEAQESVVNPFIYNINKQTKFHGLQYVEESAENAGNASAGKSIDFNISKFGFLRTAILKWTMTAGGTSGTAITGVRTGLLNCIDRVEILSSSRRLAVLDKYAFMCAISDMPRDVQMSYSKGLHMSATANQLVGGSAYNAYLNLPFSFFNNVKNALPVSFVEPVKIRVYFSDLKFGSQSTTATTHAVSDPALLCEFRVLDNEDEDATIQENYDGVLTQLNYDYETEGAVTGTLTSSADLTLEKTISSNAVASDIYIIVSADTSAQSSTVAANQKALECPLLIRSLQLVGSGQNIVPEVRAEYFEYFGRRSAHDGFHSLGSAFHSQGAEDAGQLKWVYKIQLGMDGDKQHQSGGISLREINACTVKVAVAQAGSSDDRTGDGADTTNPETIAVDNQNESVLNGLKVSLRVVVRHHTLVSTDPASGRLTNMLTN